MISKYVFSDVEMEHIEYLRQWAAERGILDAANTMKQLGKTSEEFGELLKSSFKDDLDGMLDGVGDVWVTLIIGALQNSFEFAREEEFYNTLPEFESTSAPPATLFCIAMGELNASALRGTLTKQHFLVVLNLHKKYMRYWLDDAIKMVWGVISKRTGKTVNGVFIKEEDLTDVTF
jgi:hypothetical protein